VSAVNDSTGIATTGIADSGQSRQSSPAGAPGRTGPASTPVPCGRFAPSPTGELHLGSLLAATGSYLSALSQGGRWRVRMEDLDAAREVPGAATRILQTLERFGFQWEGPVECQSRRRDHYQDAMDELTRRGLVYPCSCSRSKLARLAVTTDGEPVYPGTCRYGMEDAAATPAFRFNTGRAGHPVGFYDRLQGWYEQDVAVESGDFIVKRRDGFHAYQLAVVVDDAAQGVTEVVRGCDLLDNTPRQILLQEALGLPRPDYAHLPLLVERDGTKLAKKARSIPVDAARAPALLHQTLRLLRQSPPDSLRSADLPSLWEWAIGNWKPAALRGIRDARVETWVEA
jgi:glutamyl-Q tRNA(Asp) synthetase